VSRDDGCDPSGSETANHTAPSVRLRFIEPGKPVQNAFVESFNGRLTDECLNLHWFKSLRHAREEIARWRVHYNTKRPHSARSYQTPMDVLNNNTVSALETLAVSALPLTAITQPENPDHTGPNQRDRSHRAAAGRHTLSGTARLPAMAVCSTSFRNCSVKP